MTESFTKFRSVHTNHGIPNYQCVDEIRAFLREVCGATGTTFDWIKPGNAVTFFDGMNPLHFTKVRNAPDNHPPDGAVVVAHHVSRGSDGVYRDYGHVFNSRGSTVYYLRGFGQNWTEHHACANEYHPHYSEYNWHVIGWGIPKVHIAL